MSTLKNLLDELTKIEGLIAAVVVSRDGFVVEGAMRGGGSVDMETMAAVISAGVGSSEVMARQLAVGELQLSMIECAQGMIVTVTLGEDAIMAVTADLDAKIGNIRYQLKKRLNDIIAAV
ncbi:MAG: roadblock/LC7 domain-containing protein [Deltaproteobacteria bacterium]|nr:roadblock/LC7 domain-containing protein [Deltaproteobacteria bacterium]